MLSLAPSFIKYIIDEHEAEIVGYRIEGSRIKIYFKSGGVREAYILKTLVDSHLTSYVKYDHIIYKRDHVKHYWEPACSVYA